MAEDVDPNLDTADFYKRERARVADELFALTRAQYSPEDLAAGVYAEVHDERDDALLGLKPNAPLQVKAVDGGHSVFDDLLGRGFSHDYPPLAGMPEVVDRVGWLGFSGSTVRARGIYFENDDERRFSLFDQAYMIDGQTARRLKAHYDLTRLTTRDWTYEGHKVSERDFAFEAAPVVYAEVMYEPMDSEQGPIEVGLTRALSLFTEMQKGANGDRDTYAPLTRAHVAFVTSHDRLHSALLERIKDGWAKEDERYDGEYLASEQHRDSVKSRELALDKGSWELWPLGKAISEVMLQARYTLDLYDERRKYLKVDAIVNPVDVKDIYTNLTELEEIGAIIVTAVVQGFVDRHIRDVNIGAAVIINNNLEDAQAPTFTKSFSVGILKIVSQRIMCYDKQPGRSGSVFISDNSTTSIN